MRRMAESAYKATRRPGRLTRGISLRAAWRRLALAISPAAPSASGCIRAARRALSIGANISIRQYDQMLTIDLLYRALATTHKMRVRGNWARIGDNAIS